MKTLLLVFAVIFGLLLSAPAYSQLKNMVLIEEATNASCPPCAQQNPTFEQFLEDNADSVIGVAYHAWWPGAGDPMYTGDVTMNTNRINYYGITGVPECTINGKFAPASSGWYAGAPGDVDALTKAVTKAKSLANPFSVWVNRYTQGDSEQVKVVISSTSAVAKGMLRVIVMEKEHDYKNAGTNGEKKFRNIARKMLPTDKGTPLTLDANGTATFFFTYNYDSKWTKDSLRIIAFVQTDKNKVISTAVETTDPPARGFTSGVHQTAPSTGLSMRVTGSPSGDEKINYTLDGNESVKVTFSVIDLLGREVLPSRTEVVTPGEHVFDLHTISLASGTYRILARTSEGLVQAPIIVVH